VFADNLGLFDGMADRDRVAIFLELLGRKVRVSLEADMVAAALAASDYNRAPRAWIVNCGGLVAVGVTRTAVAWKNTTYPQGWES